MKSLKKAVYIDPEIEEYRDNPFICALPRSNSQEEARKSLTSLPAFNIYEVQLENHIRRDILFRLKNKLFQPFSNHIRLEEKISTIIRQGYIGRNIKNGTWKRLLVSGYEKAIENDINHEVEYYNETVSSFVFLGISGCGKTSAINRILSLYNQVILHEEYGNIKQVVWLKLECPYKGSLKELCLSFFHALDKIVNSQYKKKYGKARTGIDELVNYMGQLCRLHAIGVLVIDEIQKLSWQRKDIEKDVYSFFTSLVDQVGVPIILVGTPSARKIFASDFSLSRRSTGLGAEYWEQMKNDQMFESTVGLLWRYQWLRDKRPLTKEIINTFYNYSQGIIDVLIKLYMLSQWRSMVIGLEYIDTELIKTVYEDELKPIHPMISALKSGDPDKIAEFSDLYTLNIELMTIQAFNKEKMFQAMESVPEEIRVNESEKLTTIVNRLIQIGLEKDTAIPLVETELKKNPNLDEWRVISNITALLSQTESTHENLKKRSSKKYLAPKDWINCDKNDLRYLYATKGNKSAYDVLKEAGVIQDAKTILGI